MPTTLPFACAPRNLLGGHSGLEINEGRGNANKMMARLVQDAIANFEACLSGMEGWQHAQRHPREAEVVLTLPKENVEAFKGGGRRMAPDVHRRIWLCGGKT